jgi:cobalt-precorrin 5A hydrolase / cobalt-factor III methyltransferase / precorrin-3B C17-methyltransferase
MTAIVVLGPGGLALARRLVVELPGATLHGYAPRVADAAVRFDDVAGHLSALFADGQPIVALCAAGIVIRSLAPLFRDKRSEPAVVAVAEDGSVAVPLLGGHHGANDLARRIAAITGGVAAITTAGDVRLGLALDEPPPGWRVADPEAAKSVTAALLAGALLDLAIDAAEADCDWLRTALALPVREGVGRGGGSTPVRLSVTDHSTVAGDNALILHPATLAVGIGCERGASANEVRALVIQCLAQAGLSPLAVAGVFSIALKAAEPAIHAVAQELGVPARFFPADTLLAETPRLSERSDIVFRETGCWGVAEGAALAAAGPHGALALSKQRSARATCAIARSPRIIDPAALGRPRGKLAVVGIGPGHAGGRTAEAEAAIRTAGDLVGYRLYLELLGPLAARKTLHAFDLGQEETRVRAALALAAAGRSVALISSGDAGIYAMASLVFELIERATDADWARIEVVGIPGVSAMQVAAARFGAPLGHDFCAISLSDLLTPWPVIEQRLAAAAAGDFVVALYNPVSQRRRTQLIAARDILLKARAADTPVAIARNLGRDGEALRITTLVALDPAEVDMLSIVLVGSSTTRRVKRPDGGEWLYTPRGYDSKSEAAK